jgi:uncharacterized Fe-S radical SAM superfamily protein PflX
MMSVADVWIPDFKIWDPQRAIAEGIPSYYGRQTLKGIQLMNQWLGRKYSPTTQQLTRGVLIRHLLMPNYENDSLRILENLAEIKFSGPINLMTRFIEPSSHKLVHCSQETLDLILKRAKALSLSILLNGQPVPS